MISESLQDIRDSEGYKMRILNRLPNLGSDYLAARQLRGL